MSDVLDFLSNLKKPVFQSDPITYGTPPPTMKVVDPNNPLGKLSLPPPDAPAPQLQAPTPDITPVIKSPLNTASSDESDDILERFKPDTRAEDAYFELLNQVPHAETNVPLGRRILAGLSTQGQGGLKRAEEINQGPYLRKLAEFNQREGVLKNLSAAERAGNTNDRLIMSQILTDRRSARTADERERHNAETEKAARARNELSAFLAANPNHQLRVAEDGEFVAFNPKDPTKPPIKTGVKSGELSELSRLMMTQQGQNQRQYTQADLDRQMEELRQQHRLELERVQAQLKVQNEKDKPQTPTEVRIARFNAAAKLLNTDPENKRYISLGQPGTNDFELVLPSTAFWKSEAEKKAKLDRYEQIANEIYGPNWKKENPRQAEELKAARGAGSARSTPTPRDTNSNTIRQRNSVTGAIRESTDGGKTWKIVQAGK